MGITLYHWWVWACINFVRVYFFLLFLLLMAPQDLAFTAIEKKAHGVHFNFQPNHMKTHQFFFFGHIQSEIHMTKSLCLFNDLIFGKLNHLPDIERSFCAKWPRNHEFPLIIFNDIFASSGFMQLFICFSQFRMNINYFDSANVFSWFNHSWLWISSHFLQFDKELFFPFRKQLCHRFFFTIKIYSWIAIQINGWDQEWQIVEVPKRHLKFLKLSNFASINCQLENWIYHTFNTS